MKTLSVTVMIILMTLGINANAQTKKGGEKYGNTLNLGVGLGYYGYVSSPAPVLHVNFEFDVAKNFTLAPFLTYFSYRNYYYRNSPKNPYDNYYYRQSVMPVGVKGTYYFDQFVGAGPKWDFYLGASIGVAIRKTVWDDGYYGDTYVEHGNSGLYLDGHIGTEYHVNKKIGLVLDLSSGISTFCLAVHL